MCWSSLGNWNDGSETDEYDEATKFSSFLHEELFIVLMPSEQFISVRENETINAFFYSFTVAA